jgi:ribosomal protein L17
MATLKGRRLIEVTKLKTKKDRAKFVKRIADEIYPEAKRITLIMDNFVKHAAHNAILTKLFS